MDGLVCYGFPRSGSTLVWRAAKAVTGEDLPKVHAYDPAWIGLPLVATVRDLRDCVASLWRVVSTTERFGDPARPGERTRHTFEQALQVAREHVPHLEAALHHRGPLEVLRYADFVDDHGLVFDALERLTGERVPLTRRQQISDAVGIEAARRDQPAGGSFDVHDPETGLHGGHVDDVGVGSWRDVIPEDWWPDLHDAMGPHLSLCE